MVLKIQWFLEFILSLVELQLFYRKKLHSKVSAARKCL